MKTIINILSVIIASSLVFVSCSEEDKPGSNTPTDLQIYFHNKENEDKLSLKDLDITIEYTNPKGKTTIATNDELYNGVFAFKSKHGYGASNDCFRKISEPNAEGISISLSFFPVNYPDDEDSINEKGSVMKFKLILRKKGDDKIIFENTFICTFENEKGNPFVEVKPIEIEKPDLEIIKNDYYRFHIYMDLD